MSDPLAEKVGETEGAIAQLAERINRISARLDTHISTCRLVTIGITVALGALIAWLKL